MVSRCEKMQHLRLENGDALFYLGKEIPLTVVREKRSRAKIMLINGRLLLWVPYEADYAYKQRQLTKWYRKTALLVITQKAMDFAGRMGVSFHEIHIKDQKSRWGSCSSMGNLNFNWRILMAPEEVCDYVIVHELCHLIVMDHSANFWRLVGEFCPQYRSCKAWLKEHAADLYLF